MSEKDGVMTSELLIDTGSVCVKIERYEELVKAEAKLQIIENIYRADDSTYKYEDLACIFGPKGEKKDAE